MLAGHAIKRLRAAVSAHSKRQYQNSLSNHITSGTSQSALAIIKGCGRFDDASRVRIARLHIHPRGQNAFIIPAKSLSSAVEYIVKSYLVDQDSITAYCSKLLGAEL